MATRKSRNKRERRKRQMLPKEKFVKRTSLEARGILSQVANALTIADAIPRSTIIIIPAPTTGLLQRLLADRNHR
jgi:hypothetical protein